MLKTFFYVCVYIFFYKWIRKRWGGDSSNMFYALPGHWGIVFNYPQSRLQISGQILIILFSTQFHDLSDLSRKSVANWPLTGTNRTPQWFLNQRSSPICTIEPNYLKETTCTQHLTYVSWKQGGAVNDIIIVFLKVDLLSLTYSE